MKSKNLYPKLFLSTLLCMPAFSHAVIVEGTFNGHVTEAQDGNDGDPATTDVWNGNIVGQAITGSFWYDTEIPKNTAPGHWTDEAIYFSRSNWAGITFNIDGKTFDVSNYNPPSLPTSYIVDVATIKDVNANGEGEENFMLSDSVERGAEGGDFLNLEGFFGFGNSMSNVLNGISLEQEFDWINQDPIGGANGYFVYSSSIGGQYTYANASMYLSDIHFAIRDESNVPEPSSLALLTFALLGLGWRARKSL